MGLCVCTSEPPHPSQASSFWPKKAFPLPQLFLLGAEASNTSAQGSTRLVAELGPGSALGERGPHSPPGLAGQGYSTKPPSLRVPSAAIVFLRSFAASSHYAFPQPSDFRVVTGHFVPKQAPLETSQKSFKPHQGVCAPCLVTLEKESSGEIVVLWRFSGAGMGLGCLSEEPA